MSVTGAGVAVAGAVVAAGSDVVPDAQDTSNAIASTINIARIPRLLAIRDLLHLHILDTVFATSHVMHLEQHCSQIIEKRSWCHRAISTPEANRAKRGPDMVITLMLTVEKSLPRQT